MGSLRRHEGYMLRDERASGGVLVEWKTYTCHHCRGVVQMNPERTRTREYCPKCDHYICDVCGAIRKANGGDCSPIARVFEQIQSAIAHQGR